MNIKEERKKCIKEMIQAKTIGGNIKDKKEFHELKLTKTQIENRNKIIDAIKKAREQSKKICKDLKEKLSDDNIEVECFNKETDEGEPVWEIIIFNIHSNNLIQSFDISENYLTDEYYIERVLPAVLNDIVKEIKGE